MHIGLVATWDVDYAGAWESGSVIGGFGSQDDPRAVEAAGPSAVAAGCRVSATQTACTRDPTRR